MQAYASKLYNILYIYITSTNKILIYILFLLLSGFPLQRLNVFLLLLTPVTNVASLCTAFLFSNCQSFVITNTTLLIRCQPPMSKNKDMTFDIVRNETHVVHGLNPFQYNWTV